MADSGATEALALDLLEQAMDQPSDVREAWIRACGAPHAVQDRAMALLPREGAARRLLPTGGAAETTGHGPPPARIGAYRVTGLIGQGGMGAVYRGERDIGDFEHVAAIKVIRPGASSDALVRRFRHERQTLARLVHPHIARLLDGGETDAGEPFIVMEFVEGQPLLGWLNARPRSRTERLVLFQAVASAVAFAHQNLVIHGDVTASNILVDADDRPRLIDFGIARPILETALAAGPRSPTFSLTAGFAAPERIAGGPATTLADVFALGRVLGCLEERLPPDVELDAIIARATATDPDHRYATVDAMQADVAAWRSGRPVSAMGQGRRYMVGKFVGRHRLAVAASAAGAFLLAGALAVTLVANAREQAARRQAEARFEQTRAIAKTLIFDVYDEVSHVPGGTAARALLARTGLTYLDNLAAMHGSPLDVRLEVGRGYTRLAQVMGSGQESQLGKMADSNALLARAEQVLRAAMAEAPGNPDVRRAYANLLVEQSGVNLYNNNAIAIARKQAVDAQALLAPQARTDPEAAKLYAIAIQAEGDSYGWDGDYAKGRVALLRAEQFISALPPALAGQLAIRKTRSAVLRLLAEAQHNVGDDKAAVTSLDAAVALNEALAAAAPGDPGLLRKLAISLWYRAVVLREIGETKASAASIARAVELTRQLRAADGKDAGALHLFAVVGEVQAQVLGDLRQASQSFAMGREVIAAHRQIVARADNAAGARRSMAATLITVGAAHYNGADYPGACLHWREARDIFADLQRGGHLTGHDDGKTVPELQGYLAANCDGGAPRRGLPGPL